MEDVEVGNAVEQVFSFRFSQERSKHRYYCFDWIHSRGMADDRDLVRMKSEHASCTLCRSMQAYLLKPTSYFIRLQVTKF